MLSRAFSRDNESECDRRLDRRVYEELATFPRKVAVNTLKCDPPPRHVANGNGPRNSWKPGSPLSRRERRERPLLRGKTSPGFRRLSSIPPRICPRFSLLTSPARRGASEKVGSFGARLSPIPSPSLAFPLRAALAN